MEIKTTNNECDAHVRAVNDAMYVLSGKWKISILASLCFNETRRFTDLLNDVRGISNKMLSKELKDLEINKLTRRTILDTHPVSVLYELTPHGKKLTSVIRSLSDWGTEHRKEIIKD
ncbi:helix-turn-helix domain-containing protein [Chryseobacterium sp. CFS15]|uniref:winged helix-turn-helix transcriptional regulator n=1 Tax=Chryseobacterium sp. CFS15 TaxID=2986946 RepID=UPI00280904AC|nr:helix-turn-helix domain-containing protein [Chryseobacterium sp. CFS15]MDQ8141469.1 helix-turn-helix domain-containing protein [Chryseobacterium sp. CFS15]